MAFTPKKAGKPLPKSSAQNADNRSRSQAGGSKNQQAMSRSSTAEAEVLDEFEFFEPPQAQGDSDDEAAGVPMEEFPSLARSGSRDLQAGKSTKEFDSTSEMKERMHYAEQPVQLQVPMTKEEDLAMRLKRLVVGLRPRQDGELLVSKEILASFAKWSFTGSFRWDQIHRMFGSSICKQSFGWMSVTLWSDGIKALGFQGDGSAVFREICKEGLTPEQEQQKRTAGFAREEAISLAQCRKFESRLKYTASSMPSSQEGSMVEFFLSLLRQKGGTVLRAWRLDMDVNLDGKVSFMEFSQALRALSLAPMSLWLWHTLRSDPTAINFFDLDCEESANVERFGQILASSFGFDMNKAWDAIDVDKQKGKLSVDEFVASVGVLGFQGDAMLLAQGLSDPGDKKIYRSTFDYLKELCRDGQALSNSKSNLCGIFASWASHLGGPDVLIQQLGLQAPDARIAVGDLAARLTAMGFYGDGREVAHRLARATGGTYVTPDSIIKRLTGASEVPGAVFAPRYSEQRKGRPVAKQAWKDDVLNVAVVNAARPKNMRSYFSNPHPLQWSEDMSNCLRAKPPRARPFDSGRPQWQEPVDVAPTNSELPSHTRQYFSHCDTKPIRDEVKSRLDVSRNEGDHRPRSASGTGRTRRGKEKSKTQRIMPLPSAPAWLEFADAQFEALSRALQAAQERGHSNTVSYYELARQSFLLGYTEMPEYPAFSTAIINDRNCVINLKSFLSLGAKFRDSTPY